MNPPKVLFRQAALAGRRTSDAHTHLVTIAPLQSWLLLAGIGCVLAMLATWGFAGKLVTTREYPGILLTEPAARIIRAPSDGQLEAWMVSAGETLQAGQTVARLAAADGEVMDVVSSDAGEVLTLRAEARTPVRAGDPLASVTPSTASGAEVALYLSRNEIAELAVGMTAQVRPAVANQTVIWRGSVSALGDFPISREALLLAFGDTVIADSLMARGPLYEARLRLDASPAALPARLPCFAVIITRVERPISRVFPFLDGDVL